MFQSSYWLHYLKVNNINWIVVTEPSKWNNFIDADADAVIFIRDFSENNTLISQLLNYILLGMRKRRYLYSIIILPLCVVDSNINEAIIVESYDDLKEK